MFTVIETPTFQRLAAKFGLRKSAGFVAWIAANAESGDVIKGTGSLRTVRWTRPGMGKRGGARVIYFNRNDRGGLVLLPVYTKAKLDNLAPACPVKLKEAINA